MNLLKKWYIHMHVTHMTYARTWGCVQMCTSAPARLLHTFPEAPPRATGGGWYTRSCW